jgi:hypothetical protein
MFDMNTLFGVGNLGVKNPSTKEIETFKKAYKAFKQDNPESKARISIDLGDESENEILRLNGFTNIELFNFARKLGRIENEEKQGAQ